MFDCSISIGNLWIIEILILIFSIYCLILYFFNYKNININIKQCKKKTIMEKKSLEDCLRPTP